MERERRVPIGAKALEVLVCDLEARPQEAPHFGNVAGAVRAVRREPGALVVDFDPTAAHALASIVEAERLCCPEIGWHLERPDLDPRGAPGGVVRLRVEASPAQLDVMRLLLDVPGGTAGSSESR
jgi:hypothetical protein